jgi:putative two-component system response regulator
MHTSATTNAKVLIVDDDRGSVAALEQLLGEAGYHQIRSTTAPSEVLGLVASAPPDLIVLKLEMAGGAGMAVLRMLSPVLEGRWFPILALTDQKEGPHIEEAVENGAKDFVTVPHDSTQLLLRIGNLLEMRFAQLELRKQNLMLEAEIDARNQDLHEARIDVLRRLARAVEYRDDDGGQHPQRIGRTAAIIAAELGLAEGTVELIRHAAPLHDVGKIGVPDAILLKRGRLTPEEIGIMESHVAIGRTILTDSNSAVLEMAEQITLTHHEWWDGSGYPAGLKGEEIPLSGRIVALADTFDALVHERPYRSPLSIEQALEEIRKLSGRQFDPRVVRAFERLDHESLMTRVEGDRPMAADPVAPG